MTTDQHINAAQKKIRVQIKALSKHNLEHTENNLELTRMEKFLDGDNDIFDILEYQRANRNMPSLYDRLNEQAQSNNTFQNSSENRFSIKSLTAYLKHRLSSFIV